MDEQSIARAVEGVSVGDGTETLGKKINDTDARAQNIETAIAGASGMQAKVGALHTRVPTDLTDRLTRIEQKLDELLAG